MDVNQAKLYLIGLKKQVRQRELFEALDVAIEALTWKEVQEKIIERESDLMLEENREKE